ncbi:MAG: DNA replication and repair protein RecF [Solirubrobacterales bacterium]|nr:DNA replication and repair protein RecF [Solirubrobacterales bacterium]
MIVARVEADRVRSLAGVEFEPDPGLTVVIGPNGAGKTNLVEAIYFGLTSRSFRTSDRRDLIPFGTSYARCRVTVSGGMVDHKFMASASRSEGNRFTMDGARIEQSEAVLHRPMVTVFSPDRLELVKGPPAGRRAHVDSFVAARWPARAGVRSNFGRILAQRNALIARIANGQADSSQLSTWNVQFAESGAELAATRSDAVGELSERWTEAAEELGLEGPKSLGYRPGAALGRDEILAGLEERLENDLRLGRSSWGPHHDEIRLELDGRQLRRFGSQGQQRMGLLALLFAERASLLEAGGSAPLMLLDDVMSELDERRRERLVDRLLEGGQSIITAAEGELIPEREAIVRVAITGLTEAAEANGSETTGSETSS